MNTTENRIVNDLATLLVNRRRGNKCYSLQREVTLKETHLPGRRILVHIVGTGY